MSREKIFSLIKHNVYEILPDIDTSNIGINNSLKDLGANSIDRMEIITMTMEDLNIKLSLIELGKAKNINDLVNIFYNVK